MECQRSSISERCPCPKKSCAQYGLCCSCIKRHVENRTLPVCAYGASEKVQDRSFEGFARMVREGKV